MKTRNSAFELLRIVAMFMIVLYHSVYWGPLAQITTLSSNQFFAQLFLVGGKLGVNLFVMISGYFLITSRAKIEKLIPMWKQVFTYSAGFLIIFLIVNRGSVHLISFFRGFFPIIFNEYWFVTAYLMLYVLAPYLNRFIKSIPSRFLLKFIAILIVFLSILPSVFRNQTAVGDLGWFILLYFIAAYLRLYGVPKQLSGKKENLILFSVSAVLLYGSIIIMDFASLHFSAFKGKQLHFAGQESILLLLFSISIFIWVMNITPFSNKFINRVSSLTFGVYLIHDNEFIRPLLWKHIVPEQALYNTYIYPVGIIVSVLLIYVIASLIEWARQQIHFMKRG